MTNRPKTESASLMTLIAIAVFSLISLQAVNGGIVLCPKGSCEFAPESADNFECGVTSCSAAMADDCSKSEQSSGVTSCCFVSVEVTFTPSFVLTLQTDSNDDLDFTYSEIFIERPVFDIHGYDTHAPPLSNQLLYDFSFTLRGPPTTV
ncbi:MAG: hypothetical protein SGI97_03985 [candidate division Zixibacteria bacterium]|nr:hypothetical protein [candidate division Zixibacteria bacterium]